MTSASPGWYQDPNAPDQLRWWDGDHWTEHRHPKDVSPPSPQPGSTSPGTPPPPVGGPEGPSRAKKPVYKRAWFLVVAGVVAIVVLVQVFSSLGGSGSTNADAQGASSSTTTAPKAKEKAASPEPVDRATTSSPSKKGPGVGDKARDGKFEFVVRSVKCGIKEVGDQYLGKKAQGQFCAVNLSVKNIGDAPQSMFADNQYAFDAKGRKFSADAEASMYDNQSQVLWEEINPGNSVKGKVYFDIPKGATLVKLELHDSMFSGGVKVTL